MKTKSSHPAHTDEEKRGNVYQIVTKKILDAMMNGEIPWRNTHVTLKGERPAYCNYVTGKPYSFINSILLGEPGEYASFNQIKDAGGVIKKGAKAKMVIYWGAFIPKENKEKAKELEEKGESIEHLKVMFPKYYNVFNIKDTEGLKSKTHEIPQMQQAENPTAMARMVIGDYETNEMVSVVEDNCIEPRYNPLRDSVELPGKDKFSLEEDWYASVFSGMVHSTATEERCNRESELKHMIDGKTTVKEDLTAEIGSSMILTACGLQRKETHQQIAAVCQKYIDAMNKDYRLIITASNAAEKAAKYILGEFAA